ncbi:FecCD family ABC transporter permease [Aureimonas mangrovi]|uniref:FecCD family ABC transporter permease n=1 Tax=Aureimonas mangrovi TaxID=2758041 RepID=UPI00163DA3FF|nr:iron ABC transporter permease [Aureimonas mangrovi]
MVVATLLVVACALTLGVGARGVGPAELWRILTAFDPSDPAHLTVASIRLPRLVAGLVAGAALGMAGTVMQALTRNPLADPGLLGVSAGAAFSVVLGSLLLGRADTGIVTALVFPGAAIAAGMVFALGGGLRGDVGAVRLTLAGAAMNALLISLVAALVLLRSESLEVYRFWVTGSLAQAGQRPLLAMGLVVAATAFLGLVLAPVIETLSLGAAMARGLGTRLMRAQAGALFLVTVLTGAAVAVAGPIAFLGLMVPPLARRITGHNLRAELVVAAAIGATILLFADTIGRLLLAPAEVRVGVMTALMGGPVFIWIARGLKGGWRA